MKKRKIIIITIIILILILLSIIIFFIVSPKKKAKNSSNDYVFAKSQKELPGTKTYTNDKLKEAHCIDNVCIENVVFYYKGNSGRVEYTILNRNDYEVTDTLRMVFKDKSLLISYKNLPGKKRIKSTSRYVNVEIENKENYKLKKLSKEEKEKIIKK